MKQKSEHLLSPRDVGMMLLSLFSVIIVLIILFSGAHTETMKLLIMIDSGVCMIFISVFFWDLFRASNKWAYFKGHWIDLAASVPMVEQLRYARIIQVFRVIRLIQMSKSILIPLMQQKKETTLTGLLLTMFTIITFSSVLILLVEHDAPGATIHTAEDAIWWALITISTVGYGDFYPVTTAGRFIGSMVVITGVSFFGVVAGYLASVFVKGEEEPELRHLEDNQERMAQQQQALMEEIRLLREELARHQPDSSRSNQ